MSEHSVYLVPVRLDVDGTPLVLCPGLDGCFLDVHHWAGWCPSCRALVGKAVPGIAGLQDLDGLTDDQYALVEAREADLSKAHTMAVAQQNDVSRARDICPGPAT